MRLTIIVPVYNVEKYIEECLESIYSQKINDFEVLCVDDKGNDNSIKIVEEFISKNNISNLKIISQPENKGLSEARNLGINNAEGKYICFLDSDDKLEIGGIEKLLIQAEKEDLDIVEGKIIEVFETECNIELGTAQENREDSEVMDGDTYFKQTIKNNEYLSIACCRIFKKENLKNNIYFYPNIKFEDEEFSPRAIISAKRVQYINVPFYIYRRRDNSITTNMFNDEKWYHSYIKVIDNLERFAKKIRGKKSYRYLKNRIGQIALSILKNPIAYGADKIYINKIIAEVKTKKIYKIPMKSKNCFIKIQGILMMFPKVFVKLYSKRGRNEKNKRINKKD